MVSVRCDWARGTSLAEGWPESRLHQAGWCHRRMETISVVSHETVRRSVSVDFTVPAEHREDLHIAEGQWVVPLAMLATHAIRSQLFGVSVADPKVYAAGVLLIAIVAVLAGFLPSRRAASVDPARALRTE